MVNHGLLVTHLGFDQVVDRSSLGAGLANRSQVDTQARWPVELSDFVRRAVGAIVPGLRQFCLRLRVT